MIGFVLGRLGTLVLTLLFLAAMVFWLTNLPSNLTEMAKSEASVRMTDGDVALWLAQNGYGRPLPGRCAAAFGPDSGRQFCGALQGHLGTSTVFDQPVLAVIAPKLAATGWLMLYAMIVLTLGGIGLGV